MSFQSENTALQRAAQTSNMIGQTFKISVLDFGSRYASKYTKRQKHMARQTQTDMTNSRLTAHISSLMKSRLTG